MRTVFNYSQLLKAWTEWLYILNDVTYCNSTKRAYKELVFQLKSDFI
jgi:hypothetical protein